MRGLRRGPLPGLSSDAVDGLYPEFDMSLRRRRFIPFAVGHFVEHKQDPDIYGTVLSIDQVSGLVVIRLSDESESKQIGHWLLKKSSLLEAMARSATLPHRGPGAPR